MGHTTRVIGHAIAKFGNLAIFRTSRVAQVPTAVPLEGGAAQVPTLKVGRDHLGQVPTFHICTPRGTEPFVNPDEMGAGQNAGVGCARVVFINVQLPSRTTRVAPAATCHAAAEHGHAARGLRCACVRLRLPTAALHHTRGGHMAIPAYVGADNCRLLLRNSRSR